MLWQSAKWPFLADHKLSTRHTHCPHLADCFFKKSEIPHSKRAKPNPKWRQNQKDHSDGCDTVSIIWNRPFFQQVSWHTCPKMGSVSHRVYGNKWLKVSNSLPVCIYLKFNLTFIVRWRKEQRNWWWSSLKLLI